MQPSGRDPADDAARIDGRPADAVTQDGTAVPAGFGWPQPGSPPVATGPAPGEQGGGYGVPTSGEPGNSPGQGNGQPPHGYYGQPYGETPVQPFGQAPVQPFGQAPGQPYGATPGQPAYGQGLPGYPGARPGPPGHRPGVRLRPTRRELVTAAVVVAAMAAAGLAAGALWAWLAPRLEFRVVRPGLALPVLPEAEEYIAADGRFALLTLGAGVLAALLCWWSRRTRGPVLLLALTVGGLAGSLVAWRFGLLLGPGYAQADLQVVDRILRQPLELGARAALVVEPIAAVVVYLLAAGFSSRNDLGRAEDGTEPGDGTEPEDARELSSGSG